MAKFFSWAAIAIAAGAYFLYKREKEKLSRLVTNVPSFDLSFVKDWISKQDFEQYNKSYTAVLLRGEDLPEKDKFRLFFNPEQLVALCIYDKQNHKVIKSEYFVATTISSEFGADSFVEFPFEF